MIDKIGNYGGVMKLLQDSYPLIGLKFSSTGLNSKRGKV